jgi:hypothetical protein
MVEILFLAFAITALLRLPRDVRRMRERKRSTLPSGPQYQISEHNRLSPVWRAISRTN